MPIDDEFDLGKLRISPTTTAASVKQLLTIPATKPPKHDWIRVHPTESVDVSGVVLKDGTDEMYLVSAEVAEVLGGETVPFTLHPYMNRVGVLRLWPVRLPDADGKQMDWHRTAREAAALATTEWVRIVANRSLGAYDVFRATNPPIDPVWPEMSINEMVKVAFHDRGRIIRDLDHAVVRTLTGAL